MMSSGYGAYRKVVGAEKPPSTEPLGRATCSSSFLPTTSVGLVIAPTWIWTVSVRALTPVTGRARLPGGRLGVSVTTLPSRDVRLMAPGGRVGVATRTTPLTFCSRRRMYSRDLWRGGAAYWSALRAVRTERPCWFRLPAGS